MLNQQRQPNSPVPEPPAEASGQMEDLALALEGGGQLFPLRLRNYLKFNNLDQREASPGAGC